jgi:hypothetical protein
MSNPSLPSGYQRLLTQIDDAYQQGQRQATRAVNAQMVDTYWTIGRYIVEFEQGVRPRRNVGKSLLIGSLKIYSKNMGRASAALTSPTCGECTCTSPLVRHCLTN